MNAVRSNNANRRIRMAMILCSTDTGREEKQRFGKFVRNISMIEPANVVSQRYW